MEMNNDKPFNPLDLPLPRPDAVPGQFGHNHAGETPCIKGICPQYPPSIEKNHAWIAAQKGEPKHDGELYQNCTPDCPAPAPHKYEPRTNEREGNLGDMVDRRTQVYGEPIECWTRIAQMWSALLNHEVQPWEAPLMMAAMKMVRASYMPDYSDNSDDVEGYLDIFRKIIGPDMIHARTVNEFIEKKWPADG